PGVDLPPRRVEPGKGLPRHAGKLHEPEEQEGHSHENNQEPELQARSDDPTHHGWRPPTGTLPVLRRGRQAPLRPALKPWMIDRSCGYSLVVNRNPPT